MEQELVDDLDFSEVKCIKKIYDGEYSKIFKVEALGRYHGHSKAFFEPVESKLFGRELAAYSRFKETGLCQRGIVPDFYGAITTINPGVWPELRSFRKDPLPPKAILFEYIPSLERISLKNYTKQRVAKLADLLADVHAARVAHGDAHPRNMGLIIQGDVERLLWMDFDRATTFPLHGDLTEKETKLLTDDMALARDYIADSDPDWLMMWTRQMTLPFDSS
ncbi:Protein kinase-like domain [Cordyceps javanica]|uniref:Protein kinase-like domain n=1 Tax=Cordyceps javanica TaxID=43265 RepID=A0A545WDK3_9HYPO|nr:Protein kinase-like domain [Cordyceps javanica]TQW12067.1 Protein kinase-like domain [Cordyceps javanica]